MAVTLSLGALVLTLPEDLVWTDEFEWQAVQETHTRSAAGALLVDRGLKLAGRPMTLAGGPEHAWISRSDAETLFGWSLMPGVDLELVFRSVAFDVMFDQTQRPLELVPLIDFPEYDTDDRYTVVMRLLQRT